MKKFTFLLFFLPIVLSAQKNAFTVIIGDKTTCDVQSIYSIQTPYQMTYTWEILPPNAGIIVENHNTYIVVNWNQSNMDYSQPAIVKVTSDFDDAEFRVWKCCEDDTYPKFSDEILPASLSNGTWYLNGEIVINSNSTINNCHFFMGPEATINVIPPSQFNIQSSIIQSGCNHMWDGIKAYYSGGAVSSVSISNSTIEDAYVAVSASNGAFVTSYNTLFNKNLRGIVIGNFSGTHPGSISSSSFKCSNLINNTQVNLLPPHNNRRGFSGVELYNVNSATIGSTIQENKNYFTHLDYGILVIESGVQIYNNVFNQSSSTSGYLLPENGYGIYVLQPSIIPRDIVIGGANTGFVYRRNQFNGCAIGIRLDGDYNYTIRNNTFTNHDIGVFNTNTKNKNIVFNANTISNTQIGLWINDFANSNLNVYDNTLTNNTTGLGFTNVTLAKTNGMLITNNTLNGNMINGIGLSNVEGYKDLANNYFWPHILSNKVNFSNVDLSQPDLRSGILISNSPRCFVESCTLTYNNNIVDNLQADRLVGINIISSIGTQLCRNVLNYLGNGVRAESNNNSSKFILNKFKKISTSNVGYGVRCYSATIGAQGTYSYPYNNEFENFFGQVRGQGTMGSPMAWYYRNTTLLRFHRYNDQNISSADNPTPSTNVITCNYPTGGGTFVSNGEQQISSANNYIENELENQYFDVYDLILKQPTVEIDNSIYDLSEDVISNIGKFIEVNEMISESNFKGASLLNNSIIPSNIIEENQKTVNEIYLRTWAMGEYNLPNEDYYVLLNIAEQEPVKGGHGVFGARVMTKQFNILNSALNESFSKKTIIKTDAIIQPNPVKDVLFLSKLQDINQVVMFDVYGKTVFFQSLINQESITINTSNLIKGVYFIQLINTNNEVVKSEKVIIY